MKLISGHLEKYQDQIIEVETADPLEELLYGVEVQRTLSLNQVERVWTQEGRALEKKMKRLKFYLKELDFLELD